MANTKHRDIKISNILPKQMVSTFINNPPVHAKEIVEKHYIGLWIRAAGVIRSIDVMSDYITFNFEDKNEILISANFSKPVDSEVSLLNKGVRIDLIGQVFNVGENIAVLDNCVLAIENGLSISQNEVVHPKWWENTWVQIIFLFGAIAGIIGLLSLLK